MVNDPELIDDLEAVGGDEDESADADTEPRAAVDKEEDDKDTDASDDDAEKEVADGGDAKERVIGVERGTADVGEAAAFVRFAAVAFDGEDIGNAVGELSALFVFGFGGSRVVWIDESESDHGDGHVDSDKSDENEDKNWDGGGEYGEGQYESEYHGQGVKNGDVDHALEGTGEFVGLGNEGARKAVVVEFHGLVS